MKYKTVVIDPPWPISNYSTVFLPHGQFPKLPYSTSSLEEIMEFPIDDYADEESLLFLWVTTSKAQNIPVLRFGFDLIEHWGFKYHQMITWDKGSGHALFSPLQARTEHCLFAYKGNFHNLINKNYGVMQNLISTNYTRVHSEKPARFYQLLRAWTPKPRIDIFARKAHEGFDGWGNEYVGEGPLARYFE